MSTKSLILATLGGAIVSFLLGWLLYGAVLASFFAETWGAPLALQKARKKWAEVRSC